MLRDTYDFTPAILRSGETALDTLHVVLDRPLIDLLVTPEGIDASDVAGAHGTAAAAARGGVPVARLSGAGSAAGCVDKAGAQCVAWAAQGECEVNAAFMRAQCQRACGGCKEL